MKSSDIRIVIAVARQLNTLGIAAREALGGRIIVDGVDALAELIAKVQA